MQTLACYHKTSIFTAQAKGCLPFMKSGSITIKDIAAALNLSYSTVSRALKDSYMISEPIRKKVQQYAQEHHYRPNLTAQNLRSNKSHSIGVLLPAIPNSFFAEVISGIESVAYERDYKIIITQSFESREREIKNLEYLAWHSIDGLLASIATETTDISHFQRLLDRGTPIVFFDRVPELAGSKAVTADNEEGSYKAIMHFLEQGFTKIGHITSSPGASISQERLKGHLKALKEKGIAVNAGYIKYCQHGGMIPEEIDTAVAELLSMPDPPEALFTASDRITIGAMSALRKKNIAIPAQMAIAGFSNFSAPELFNPALTTIRQPAFEMGKVAVELLLQSIERKKAEEQFEKKVLATELVIRESSRK